MPGLTREYLLCRNLILTGEFCVVSFCCELYSEGLRCVELTGPVPQSLTVLAVNRMEDHGIPSSQRPADDVVMGDPSSSLHANTMDLNGKPQSRNGDSASNGGFRLKKVNGCLQRAEDRPILIIQPEQVSEDVEYWSNHALICKFLGLRLSLPVLESWARRIWNPEGDMEVLLAANNYFMVIFSSMSDRNKAFEGGPYFFNQVGLFIKPWHSGFNSAEEIPSRVPVWIRLPRLPLEFWREDILHSISLLLGRPVGSATQTQDRKVISFARICVEVDLNNPLPDSMEICMGASSWIQQLDYETLPFRCRICHEYGHLYRYCPRTKPPTVAAPGPPGKDKGKANSSMGPVDSEGFTQVKSRNKGKGKKRAGRDRQTDDTFNRFETLGDLAQEEGIPIEILAEAKGLQEVQVGDMQNEEQASPTGELQVGQLDIDLHPLLQVSGDIGDSQALMGPVLTAAIPNKPKGNLDSKKGNKASLDLGIQQKTFKKGSLEKLTKSGRKTDQEKVKIMGENLVESGSVKAIDSHFSHHHK